MEMPYGLERLDNQMSTYPVGGLSRTGILFHYIFRTLPRVKKLLRYWEKEACKCQDPELRRQALASLHNKAFHCQGGAVYSVLGGPMENNLLRLIVAYQTICDYLDNLCDRAGNTDEKAFTQLHLALIDALSPNKQCTDYYCYYPWQDDGGYLIRLVNECRECVQLLPNYTAVYDNLIPLANWYSELQVKKHLNKEQREQILRLWAEEKGGLYPAVRWQEFAAATGSTLAIFAFFVLAAGEQQLSENIATRLIEIYFPWICGLHILLDYYIDQEEDREGGDLNFTFYYTDRNDMLERLTYFVQQARNQARLSPVPKFDKLIVEGLLAMYLSDDKVEKQGLGEELNKLLKGGNKGTKRLLRICRVIRRIY